MRLTPKLESLPNNDEILWYTALYLPTCIGAVYCTHIEIYLPGGNWAKRVLGLAHKNGLKIIIEISAGLYCDSNDRGREYNFSN